MAFSSKRGRPKKIKMVVNNKKEEIDYGTEELREKRKQGVTAEPIDVCKQKEIISDDEYRAALHFRWLYTIKFGAPSISAVNINGFYGKEISDFDESWQISRETEYAMAIEKLRHLGGLKLVMNIAVFNIYPEFLLNRRHSKAQAIRNVWEYNKLCESLTALSELWEPKTQLKQENKKETNQLG